MERVAIYHKIYDVIQSFKDSEEKNLLLACLKNSFKENREKEAMLGRNGWKKYQRQGD